MMKVVNMFKKLWVSYSKKAAAKLTGDLACSFERLDIIHQKLFSLTFHMMTVLGLHLGYF